jgi:hypothetical protein
MITNIIWYRLIISFGESVINTNATIHPFISRDTFAFILGDLIFTSSAILTWIRCTFVDIYGFELRDVLINR